MLSISNMDRSGRFKVIISRLFHHFEKTILWLLIFTRGWECVCTWESSCWFGSLLCNFVGKHRWVISWYLLNNVHDPILILSFFVRDIVIFQIVMFQTMRRKILTTSLTAPHRNIIKLSKRNSKIRNKSNIPIYIFLGIKII